MLALFAAWNLLIFMNPLQKVSDFNLIRSRKTDLVRSKAGSSSCNSSTSGISLLTGAPFLVGLAAGSLLGAGLLLGGTGGAAKEGFVGLKSKAGPLGVLPISAYLQKGAGDEVGMC
jgi:hypothetical protein